jgi:hypothetical protein
LSTSLQFNFVDQSVSLYRGDAAHGQCKTFACSWFVKLEKLEMTSSDDKPRLSFVVNIGASYENQYKKQVWFSTLNERGNNVSLFI